MNCPALFAIIVDTGGEQAYTEGSGGTSRSVPEVQSIFIADRFSPKAHISEGKLHIL